MPTYQYACTACDHRFEAVQSFSDAALTDCPECSGRVRKLFSSVGIVFKGSGFYRTDSRSSSGAKGEGGSSGEGGSGDTRGSGDKGGAGSDAPSGGSTKPAAAKEGSSGSSGGNSSTSTPKASSAA